MKTELKLKLAFTFLGTAGSVAILNANTQLANKKMQPNVLIFLVDDMGWNDLGCTGSKFYETPHIDRLASHGIIFSNGYAACSVSSPSRASILTGKTPARHGITSWIGDPCGQEWATKQNARLAPPEYSEQISHNELMLQHYLKKYGYVTLIAGKWHLGDIPPEEFGFDFNQGGYEAGNPKGGYFSPYNNPKLQDGPDGEDLTIRLAKETVNFIDDQVTSGKPFFAYLSFYAVHSPIQTTQERWQYFRDKAEEIGITPFGGGFKIDRTLPVRQIQDNPVYSGLISSVDEAVGLVMDKLDRLGIADNTIVIFTSDNGGVSSGDNYSTSNLPLRGGKGRQWEGGTRVPFIMMFPGEKNAGRIDDTPVIHMDIYPTVLDLIGLPLIPSQHIDGVSLKSLLAQNKSLEKRTLYWHYPHYGNQGGEPASYLREGDWKLISYHEDGHAELYDLVLDPGELNDVSGKYPARVKELKAKLDQWLAETNACMPEINPLFDPQKYQRQLVEKQQKLMEREETLRIDQLKKDWQPNHDWWGSRVTVD